MIVSFGVVVHAHVQETSLVGAVTVLAVVLGGSISIRELLDYR
jgi:hypothetical protein